MKHSLTQALTAVRKAKHDQHSGHVTGSKSEREYVEDVLATVEFWLERAIERNKEAKGDYRQ